MELATKKRVLSTLKDFFQESIAIYKGESVETENQNLSELRNQLVIAIDGVRNENGWFTSDSILSALEAWAVSLQEEKLDQWLDQYSFEEITSKKVGVIIGSEIEVILKPDESKYGIPLPEEMEELLKMDEEANHIFHTLTKGKQRSLLYIIGKPKNTDSRLNKAVLITRYLKLVNGKLDFKEMTEYLKINKI